MGDVEIVLPANQESTETPDIKWERVEPEKVPKSPPIGYADKLVTDILKFEPHGHNFDNDVTIKIPHKSLKCDKKRIIHLFESDDGEKWKQHETRAVETVEDDEVNEKTVIYTDKIPGYVALVNQLRIERVIVGPEGGSFSSEIHPGAQVTLAEGVLKKEMKFGLQVQLVSKEAVKEALQIEHGVYISPFVSIYPFMRKFHRPMWVTIPLPVVDNDYTVSKDSIEIEQEGATANIVEEKLETVKDDNELECEPSTSKGNKSSKLSLLGRIKKMWKRIKKSRSHRGASQASSKCEGGDEQTENAEEGANAKPDSDGQASNAVNHSDNTVNDDSDSAPRPTEEPHITGVARIPKSVKLLASLIDEGKVPLWEDVTDITPLVDEPADIKCKDAVLTFETTVSGRFCLISVNPNVEENIKDVAQKLFVHICKDSHT